MRNTNKIHSIHEHNRLIFRKSQPVSNSIKVEEILCEQKKQQCAVRMAKYLNVHPFYYSTHM